MKSDYETQIYEIERRAKKEKAELEKENRFLHKVIFVLEKTVDKIFDWVSIAFSSKNKEELKSYFEQDTSRRLDPYSQIDKEDRRKSYEMDR